MKIQESAENYLESILMISERKGDVRSIDIVNELEFSKPSVSIAMKNLRENGYILVDEKGSEIAEKMYERHKLFSKLFVSLGVSEATASKDACRVEHILSDETYAAIKKVLKEKGLVE